MTARGSAACLPEHRARDDSLPMQHHKPAHWSNELMIGIAPAHHFRNRQLLQREADLVGEHRIQIRTAYNRSMNENLLLAVALALELFDRNALLLRKPLQRLRGGSVGAEPSLDGWTFRDRGAIGGPRFDIANQDGKSPWCGEGDERGTCRGESIGAQILNQRLGKSIPQEAQRFGRQLFGEKLDEEARLRTRVWTRVRTHWAGPFSIGNPSA